LLAPRKRLKVRCWSCGFEQSYENTECISCGARLLHRLDAFFRYWRARRKKVYYFSFPYSREPTEFTIKVAERVKRILKARKDIVPIVPHYVFDLLLGKQMRIGSFLMITLPEGYSNPETADWEIELISRCDALVYEPKMMRSDGWSGVIWEVAIAKKLGVSVYTYDEVEMKNDLGDVGS